MFHATVAVPTLSRAEVVNVLINTGAFTDTNGGKKEQERNKEVLLAGESYGVLSLASKDGGVLALARDRQLSVAQATSGVGDHAGNPKP